MKFYPADWQSDQALRVCSLAARALWIECMAIMHRAEPYGHLLVNGLRPSNEQLAVLAGCPSDQLPTLLDELIRAGVPSRTRNGTIYSRRMTRDERRRRDGEKAAETGSIAGSRRSRQATENKPENLPPPGIVGGAVDPPPSHPEARSQKERVPSADALGASPPDASPLDLKRELWHRGKAYLASQGVDRDTAGKLLGKWRKTASDLAVMDALARAEAECASDVIPFIEACLKRGQNGAATGRPIEDRSAFRHGLARAALARVGPGEPTIPDGDAG